MVNTAKPKLISQHTISRPTDRTLVCFSESILVTVFEINGQIYQARVIPGRVGIGTCAGNVHGRVFFVGKGLAAVEFILSVQISNIGNNLAFTVFIGRGGDGDRLAHASAGEGLGLCLLWLSIGKHCCQS